MFLPPPLPAGSHEVVLEATLADGLRLRSHQSITIVISADKTARALVAMMVPSQPTALLSSPEEAGSKVLAAGLNTNSAGKAEDATSAARLDVASAGDPHAIPNLTRGELVEITTVEVKDGGRLFVTGRPDPGSTIRFYLSKL